MLKGFAYTATKKGLKGNLTNIKSAKVIVTGQVPKWHVKYLRGNPIEKTFIGVTLKNIGIKNAKWLYCSGVSHGAAEKREEFLRKIKLEMLCNNPHKKK